MKPFLLIGPSGTSDGLGSLLQAAGYEILTAPSGQRGLELLDGRDVDLILFKVSLPDMSGLQLLEQLRSRQPLVPILVYGSVTIRDAVSAVRLGATDVIEKPLTASRTLRIVKGALQRRSVEAEAPNARGNRDIEEAHAAARWARALAPVINAPKDPRTVTDWSRLVFASPGALRNWCSIAGVSARRSLVFGRLMRVACLNEVGRHRPQDLLDVVDRRTLERLLKYAGLNPERPFPKGPSEFLQQQALIRHPDHLFEIKRATGLNGVVRDTLRIGL